MSLFKACSTGPARARVRVVLMAALLTSLVGCSSVTQKPAGSDASTATAATAATAGAGSPWLALAPSALGCNVSVQQRLTVQPPGQSPKELDALLEIDAGVLRLAILNLGQMVGTLEWDGVQLNQNLSRWWPAQLKPEQVLSDLQLSFWPQAAIVGALPPQWTLQAAPNERVLKYAGTERAKVNYLDSQAVEIVYAQGAWTLRIDSPGGANLCQKEVAKP